MTAPRERCLMNKYLAVAMIFFKSQLIYRFDVSMSMLGTVGRVLFAWLVWGAIFADQDNVGGFHFEAMLLYYVVSSFIATLDVCFGVSGEISHEIRNGNFSKFMVIPINPQLYWLAQNYGVVFYLALFALPASIVSGLVFGAGGYIGQPAAIFLGLIMVFMGLTFMVTYHVFIGILAFKFQDVGFFLHFQSTIIQFAQGAFLPINLLPYTMQQLIRLLPFPHFVFTPTMLFIGKMHWYEGLHSIGVLAIWLIIMTMAAQAAYQRLRVKYDGVGV